MSVYVVHNLRLLLWQLSGWRDRASTCTTNTFRRFLWRFFCSNLHTSDLISVQKPVFKLLRNCGGGLEIVSKVFSKYIKLHCNEPSWSTRFESHLSTAHLPKVVNFNCWHTSWIAVIAQSVENASRVHDPGHLLKERPNPTTWLATRIFSLSQI